MACNTLQTTTVENPTPTAGLLTEIHRLQFFSKKCTHWHRSYLNKAHAQASDCRHASVLCTYTYNPLIPLWKEVGLVKPHGALPRCSLALTGMWPTQWPIHIPLPHVWTLPPTTWDTFREHCTHNPDLLHMWRYTSICRAHSIHLLHISHSYMTMHAGHISSLVPRLSKHGRERRGRRKAGAANESLVSTVRACAKYSWNSKRPLHF